MNWFAIFIIIRTANGHYVRPHSFEVELPDTEPCNIAFAICEELEEKFSNREDPSDPFDYELIAIRPI